jgi:hypothetical protein
MESIVRENGQESDLVEYNELIKNLVDKSQRNEFTKNTAKTLINSDIFDRNGEMKITKAEDFFNYGFVSGLTGLARQDSEVQLYFNELEIDSLKKIMSPEELKEVQNYYSKVQSLVGNVHDAFDAIRKGLSNEK